MYWKYLKVKICIILQIMFLLFHQAKVCVIFAFLSLTYDDL